MRKAGSGAWVLVAALLVPVEAVAQQSAAAPEGPFRKWDVGGSFGLRFGQPEDDVIPIAGSNLDAGRYWTAHVRTDVALTTTGGGSSWSSYEGLPQGGYRYTEVSARPAGLSVGASYQFLNNVFVHPYVSGGVRLAWVSESRHTISFPYQITTDQPSSSLAGRPFVGGGFKSYFHDGRTFMRSELLMAVGPHGSSHAMLRIGAGIDF